MEKKELRRLVRQAKKEHKEEELRQMSETICQRLLSHEKVREADTILAYWSLHDEVNTHSLVMQLYQQGKRVLLPKVISDTEMTIHEFQGMESMKEGSFGILEPTTPAVDLRSLHPSSSAHPSPCIIGIIPGMAFSPDGYRLGRGRGYYDRCLSRLANEAATSTPYLYSIGICFPFQLLPEIPHEDHDVRMDEVICGRKTIKE